MTPAEAEAAKRQLGMDIDAAAKTLLDQFDDDGDGALYDQKFLGIRFGTEARTSTVKVTYTLGLLVGRPQHDFVKVTTRTTWSLDRLVQKADVNGDRIAGRLEIAAVIRTYDTNGDGRLSNDEFLRLRSELGAQQIHSRRTIDPVERRKSR